jgi:hypothetical protein
MADAPSLLQHPYTEYHVSGTLSSSSTSARKKISSQNWGTGSEVNPHIASKSSSSSSRKRRRPTLILTLPFDPSVDSRGRVVRSSSKSTTLRKNVSFELSLAAPKETSHPDQPDWAHLGHLLAALLLTSGLAVLSALDAKQQCLQHESYALSDLLTGKQEQGEESQEDVDEEMQAYYSEQAEVIRQMCSAMFRHVIVPTGAGTVVTGLGALLFVKFQRSDFQSLHNTCVGDYFFHVTKWLAFLLLLVSIIVGLQLYNMANIMLIPRQLQDNDNPYLSLAAVDRYGHVGGNANLYYLTWMSVGLALALLYQVGTAFVRTLRRASRGGRPVVGQGPSALLLPAWEIAGQSSSTSAPNSPGWQYLAAHPRETLRRLASSRAAWYNSLYKLRIRTGIWTAALFSCLVIIASSQYVGSQVLWPVAQQQQYYEFSSGGTLQSYVSMCRVIKEVEQTDGTNKLPPQLCHRTVAAWLAGVIAATLTATAISMHLTARYCSKHRSRMADANEDPMSSVLSRNSASLGDYHDELALSLGSWRTTRTAWDRVVAHHPRLPLRTELLLSIVLSVLLGTNAVFCTGVQGPAATVGNLYYSSWIAFLLCLRIALGCLEECYNLEEEEESSNNKNIPRSPDSQGSSAGSSATPQHEDQVLTAPDTIPNVETAETTTSCPAPVLKDEWIPTRVAPATLEMWSRSRDSQESTFSSSGSDPMEKVRLGHVRSYFFLGIFSVICASSAYDAASNQQAELTTPQVYMMVAPFVVATQSILLFTLCLSKMFYSRVSWFCCGGLCSIVSFGLLLCNLILTMHSEDSWAVNGIGEIEMANLYYFSWASIITAGLQMSSYIKRGLGIKMNDFMSVVWLAIVKVCFVILGAALHIWHTISDNCEFDEITSGAVTFCSRTVLAIIVALTGMFVGATVVLVRLLLLAFPVLQCRRLQAHVEMLISLFLFLLFGAAVALITGIGGPGQSVGDLYYSTWLAFWVSLGVFINCYSELNAEEREQQSDETSPHKPDTCVQQDCAFV